jgi:predicted ATPase
LLTGLRLENFKSWDDTGQVRLAPFTVFFGRNSSGKSSLLQALLLMKQTTESLDQRQVLNLGGNDALVDLGTFSDVAFRHETTRDVSLAFDWRLPRVLDIAVPVKHRVRADRLSFRATIGVTGSQQRLPEIAVKEMRYVVGTDTATSVGMRRLGPRNYELVTNGLDIALRSGMRTNLPDPVKCYSFPEVATRSFTDSAILLELPYQFEELMSGISYVSPLRSRPSRTYQWRGSSPASVGPSGENTVAALLASNNEPDWIPDVFQATVGTWLKRMGVVSEFEIVEIGTGTDLYELRVIAPGGTTPVSIPDAGFGVSQVLPVLVQAFYAASDTSVLLEQPEIHLHPAAQSVLGDALLAAVQENDVQLVVETHSEHLLHRIQRRIAEEQITKDDVALYFIETSQGRSEIHELKVDQYGNITNWPQDFFGDEMSDLAAMTEAAAERRNRHS